MTNHFTTELKLMLENMIFEEHISKHQIKRQYFNKKIVF
jgi:hypothetical protein